MVPPQPYSGSPGCPPVTTTLSLGFVGDALLGDGSAAVVANGSPTAKVVPSQLALLSMFRREIGFMCSSWMLVRRVCDRDGPTSIGVHPATSVYEGHVRVENRAVEPAYNSPQTLKFHSGRKWQSALVPDSRAS